MNPQADIAIEKARLRLSGQEARLALGEEEYGLASAAICERIAALPEVADAGTISVYWPLLARREVDTRPLIRRLVEAGRRVVLPIVPLTGDEALLEHAEFGGEALLRPNRWGVLEPDGPRVGVEEIDAVVAPAVCVGRNLHRIGYGRGYYDALLRKTAAHAVGAVFAACLVDQVPHEGHDTALTVVVTEHEIVRSAYCPGRNH